MKKIIFTIITVLYSLNAFCQIALDNVGSIEFPAIANKVSKEQAMEHIKNKLEENKILTKTFPSRRNQHLYIIKDVLIDFNFANYPPGQKVDIMKRKKESDGVFSINKTYKSEIREVGDNKAFITNMVTSGNIEMYQFFLYNKEGTKVIVGMLDFHRNNKEAATNILDYILQHAKFKD